ncbi:MAG: trypsin-like serine protease [Bdellovibrionota bacterium]
MKMKRILMNSLLSASSLLALNACGNQDTSTSEQKITNGKVIANSDYPSVVMLYDAKMGAICTGTFVTETTVIAAAHCTMSGEIDSQGNVDGSLLIVNVIDLAAGEVQAIAESTSMVRNPLWEKNGKEVNKWDLSLITFPKGTAKAVSDFATAKPKANDALTIVGYGLNQSKNLFDGSSAGIKRVGANTVTAVSDGFIQFKGQSATTTADGTKSSASGGDSGGPLFIGGKLAGVTSGGGADWFGLGSSSTSLYVDLSSAESRTFLSAHSDLLAK